MSSLIKLLPAWIAAAVLLTGCDNDDDITQTPASTTPARVRVIHASADAPNVNVLAGTSTLVSNLAFKAATPFQNVAPGVATVRVNGILPSSTPTVIGPVDLPFESNVAYSILALGDVATIQPLVIPEATTPVPAGSVRARVVHAAADAPQVDVYVTAPIALLAQSVNLARLAFREQSGQATVPAGDYRIRVTAANNPNAVVFDSGTVALPSGGDLLIVAVENTGPGAAPISLLVSTGTSSFEILDSATPAQLRVVHASPDAPAVDVVVNDNFGAPVLQDVPFTAFSDYLTVPGGAYNVKVTPANSAGVIVIDANVTLDAGKRYSVYATGPLATIAPYVLVDDNRPVATNAKVRIVHTAPSAGAVDVYVTAPGASIATAAPALTNVRFRAESGYLGLAAGSYDVTVTPTGTKTAAIGPATITIANGGVYTAAARDAVGGSSPFGLILLDDFVP
jgi:hypothetical protein